MSNQYPNYYPGNNSYYFPDQYFTNAHGNNYIPQAQDTASSVQYVNPSYQVPTTPKQSLLPSSQHSTPLSQLPLPNKGSSSQPTSSSKSNNRKPHSCDDPATCGWCKRKNRSGLGFCEYLKCNSPRSPTSMRLCEKHLQERTSTRAAYRKKNGEQNKCKSCPRERVAERMFCEMHLENRRADAKRQRENQHSQASTSGNRTSGSQPTNPSYYTQSQGMEYPQGQHQLSSNLQSNMQNYSQTAYNNTFTQLDYSYYPSPNQSHDQTWNQFWGV
ncbi:uncharacterized protein F4807DRAFT_410257 [Annulohypoxylon truncatum]|uniref:uncharacterized protein n=1 Tax=Annulohypoxylon truncatum TaxID=327061 RepID=UPI0020084BA9|nr:uncharacterized protein F4807DRAFT_410257 [Annulohypoxylon truncatum]KAI1213243.1 hypothetical protein F4807DRAFT_410257 [Annulohypoxylon truncatum]